MRNIRWTTDGVDRTVGIVFATALAGLGFSFGLIVAIGAQNAFVLRQGLRREHVGVVVAICALSDIILISLGTAGIGALIAEHDTVLRVVTVAGAAVLLTYAVRAARRAWHPGALVVGPDAGPGRLAPVVLSTLAFTWLNPHVYLDTLVLLGSVASTYRHHWAFAMGAMTASVTWFALIGYGAAALRPLFAKPAAWRVLDLAVAMIMAGVAVDLLVR